MSFLRTFYLAAGAGISGFLYEALRHQWHKNALTVKAIQKDDVNDLNDMMELAIHYPFVFNIEQTEDIDDKQAQIAPLGDDQEKQAICEALSNNAKTDDTVSADVGLTDRVPTDSIPPYAVPIDITVTDAVPVETAVPVNTVPNNSMLIDAVTVNALCDKAVPVNAICETNTDFNQTHSDDVLSDITNVDTNQICFRLYPWNDELDKLICGDNKVRDHYKNEKNKDGKIENKKIGFNLPVQKIDTKIVESKENFAHDNCNFIGGTQPSLRKKIAAVQSMAEELSEDNGIVHNYPDENSDRNYIEHRNFIISYDRHTRIPYYTVEMIRQDNLAEAEHRHCEALQIENACGKDDHSSDPNAFDRVYLLWERQPPKEIMATRKKCPYCAYSNIWNIFHQYYKFLLTRGCKEISVISGRIVSDVQGIFPLATHFFKIIYCEYNDGSIRLECYRYPIAPMCDQKLQLASYLVQQEVLRRQIGFWFFEEFNPWKKIYTNTNPDFVPL